MSGFPNFDMSLTPVQGGLRRRQPGERQGDPEVPGRQRPDGGPGQDERPAG